MTDWPKIKVRIGSLQATKRPIYPYGKPSSASCALEDLQSVWRMLRMPNARATSTNIGVLWTPAPPQGINPESDLRAADDLHINDVAEVTHIRLKVVMPMRRGSMQSFCIAPAADAPFA